MRLRYALLLADVFLAQGIAKALERVLFKNTRHLHSPICHSRTHIWDILTLVSKDVTAASRRTSTYASTEIGDHWH